MNCNPPDTLYHRILSGTNLTEAEGKSLYDLVAKGCYQPARRLALGQVIEQMVKGITSVRAFGIYERVRFVAGDARYNAGHSYPDEIRALRKTILEG